MRACAVLHRTGPVSGMILIYVPHRGRPRQRSRIGVTDGAGEVAGGCVSVSCARQAEDRIAGGSGRDDAEGHGRDEERYWYPIWHHGREEGK